MSRRSGTLQVTRRNKVLSGTAVFMLVFLAGLGLRVFPAAASTETGQGSDWSEAGARTI